MKAPCGQEDCDCGHTIERLRALVEKKGEALQTFRAYCIERREDGAKGDWASLVSLTDIAIARTELKAKP
ncbi:hypothetical protein LCGC14_1309220 [marine sediment metagenome]|uniref:Uncharacterized protein n=1 Tax=marine sediment metagenome TaxID=412755 RepID=A0A0F9NQC3_9ZZZZ